MPHAATAGAVLSALLVLAAVPARAAVAPCPPWPGEPDPLPDVADADPVGARWAELRAFELTRLAREVEDTDRDAARRLWRHVACLDPASPEAREGLHRTGAVRVVRPELVDDPASPRAPAETPAAAVARLARVSLRAPVPMLAAGPSPAQRANVEVLVTRAESVLQAARFREALDAAGLARETLAALPDAPSWTRLQRTRIAVVAGTAEVALGRHDAARARFAQARSLDPQLELDPLRTSPKVMRVFREAAP